MNSQLITLPNPGFVQTKLEKHHVDFLWKRIKEGEKNQEDHKANLAGNVSKSFKIKDENDYFFNEVLLPHSLSYHDKYNDHPIRPYTSINLKLSLFDLWCNYQYKHEFNPFHHHTGVYSFAIWMKIPYDWREQNKMPFLDGVKENDKKAGVFEFEYTDIFGGIRNYGYRLDKNMEGTMLFFPASLKHTVYPFFNTDEPRISVAGNVTFGAVYENVFDPAIRGKNEHGT